MTHDAWNEMMKMPMAPVAKPVSGDLRDAFESIFRIKRSSLPAHCSCGLASANCPPGPPGLPGRDGEDGGN